jgi:alkylation response protein AidB-like acyl-CoA dehydrogenase
MDLQYSEEQHAIQQQAREFMDKQCPLERVKALWETADGMDDALWRAIAELGWLGMLLPEEHGGMGLGATEMSRVLEEAGRGLLPGPFLATLLGAQAILLGGNEAQRAAWLPPIADGKLRVALVRSGEGGRWDAAGGLFRATPGQGGTGLHGEKIAVAGAGQAGLLVVAAVEGDAAPTLDGLAWHVVDADAPGVTIQPLEAVEGGIKQAGVTLRHVTVAADRRLTGAPGSEVARGVANLADLALAFDALGGAERAMHMAVEYAKIREAFGQPIGSYQAIKHQCADMLYAVESLRVIAQWAAWVLDVPPEQSGADAAVAVAMARAAAIEAYDLVIKHATQVQGAIATTEEHQMHLFAKRSRVLAHSFGNLAAYQETILAANGFPALAQAGA